MGTFEENFIPVRDNNWTPPPKNLEKKSTKTVVEKEPDKIVIRLEKVDKNSESYFPRKGASDYFLSYATRYIIEGTIEPLFNLPKRLKNESESQYRERLSQDKNMLEVIKKICEDNDVSAYFIFDNIDNKNKQVFFDLKEIKKDRSTLKEVVEEINKN